MTPQEISELLHIPEPKLRELCGTDENLLSQVLDIATNEGIQIGLKQSSECYNKIFKGVLN